jgi:hypothetical protein
MKSKRFNILTVAIGFFCLAFICNITMANNIVKTLEDAPSWTLIPPEDGAARTRLLAALEPLRKKSTDEIREGVLKYVAKLKPEDRTDGMSKIYVLNRIIFNVPSDELKCHAVFFGGWIGVPVEGDKINMMWPIGKDDKCHLVIAGVFSGYAGEAYRPLAEFDHFKTTYGRRSEGSNPSANANP